MEIAVNLLTLLAMVCTGLLAGAIGTFLGIGGGSIVSPTLIALGIEPHYAVSASLTAVVGTSLGGLTKFYRRKLIKIRIALILEIATILGAFAGGCIAVKLSGRYIALAVACALTLAGTITLLQPKLRPCGRLSIAIPLSILAGVISAATGIGGGVIKMPIMLAILGLNIHEALATSKLMVGITAATGLSTYIIHNVYDPYLALPPAIGTYLGATIASRAVLSLKRDTVRKIATTLYYTMAIITIVKMLIT